MANCINKFDADNLPLVIHQKHIIRQPFDMVNSAGFRCADVISMEKQFGKHIDSCPHVGFIAATKCCIKDKK
jgi:hypothetical protein